MAKDLGTITHEIKTTGGSGDGGGGGGKSNTDALSGSGRGGGGVGGVGDVIRGVSRGGIGGGGQAMAKVMGFAKLAMGIGIAIAAIGLFTMAVKKVINIFISWVKSIEQGIEKFSAYNAQLAQVQAMKHVGEIRRNIQSAGRQAGGMAIAGGSMERIRNAMQPVKDAFSIMKTGVVNTFLPVIERLVKALRWLTIKVLDVAIWFSEAGVTIGNVVGILIDSVVGVSGVGKFFFGLGGEPTKADEMMIKELKAIRAGFEREIQDSDGRDLNLWLSEVGRQLTSGKWDPFGMSAVRSRVTGEQRHPTP